MNYLTGSNVIEYLANTPQITFEVTERCKQKILRCVILILNKICVER